ncbi:fluoride efflux transporter FluC [Lentilactobacillus kisonensis]|uniref:Fluoride-specific ion channel FluC n=2 Tax=Lentilactobacillus kisonensis TaxID=481722 RepID=H1LEF5_9LACO|nr:CrcB family protein [Lentilactobacillus kisonensis]EHO52478.1 protein CrcB [Lentilactobacillus kisonensis F0435]KRL22938.1 protein CrcB [Lentilactobacillus kisonensis DSM 19906 = JCM 15041]
MIILHVALGAGIGAILRYELTVLGKRVSRIIPYSTAIINSIGSLIAGILTGMLITSRLSAFLLTGLCGGLTTFSTFTTDTFVLLRNKRFLIAAVYWIGTVMVGIGAAAIGIWLGMHV